MNHNRESNNQAYEEYADTKKPLRRSKSRDKSHEGRTRALVSDQLNENKSLPAGAHTDCPWCGKSFTKPKANFHFCSMTCTTAGYAFLKKRK